jgi:hypothetical protein
MAGTPIFSKRFLAQAGLTGTGPSVTVPAGRVYIVKQVTIYAAPLLATTAAFFEDDSSGAALFASRFLIDAGGWVGLYGALVFEAGQGFHFQVNNTLGEGADVYAGGYDLSA